MQLDSQNRNKKSYKVSDTNKFADVMKYIESMRINQNLSSHVDKYLKKKERQKHIFP